MNPSDCSCEGEHCSNPACRSKAPSTGSVTEAERIFPVPVKRLGMDRPGAFGQPPSPPDEVEQSIRRTFL